MGRRQQQGGPRGVQGRRAPLRSLPVLMTGAAAAVMLSACGGGTATPVSSMPAAGPGDAATAAVADGGAASAATGSGTQDGQMQDQQQDPTGPAVPSAAGGARATPGGGGAQGNVKPPAGSLVQDVLLGKGTLVYRCTAGHYTLLKTPVQLYIEHGGFAGTQPALLSWRFKNGTRVDGALVREVRQTGTLSQALLKVVKVTGGGANDRATTFIVRQPEQGGVPPATCTTPGTTLAVPFQTRYTFYRSGTAAAT